MRRCRLFYDTYGKLRHLSRYFDTIADACIYMARRFFAMRGECADDREVARIAYLFAARWSCNSCTTNAAIDRQLGVYGYIDDKGEMAWAWALSHQYWYNKTEVQA